MDAVPTARCVSQACGELEGQASHAFAWFDKIPRKGGGYPAFKDATSAASAPALTSFSKSAVPFSLASSVVARTVAATVLVPFTLIS